MVYRLGEMWTAVLVLLALCGCATMPQASAEKGDTYIAVMSADGLPPNSGYSPPTGKVGVPSLVVPWQGEVFVFCPGLRACTAY